MNSKFQTIQQETQLFSNLEKVSKQISEAARRKGYFQVILPEMRTGSFFQELKCFCARNKLRTSVFPRIFNYSTEHLYSPGQYKYLLVSSFRRRKNAIFFSGSKQIPQRNTSVSQEKR